MQVAENMAVSIHYVLTNKAGEQLDSSRDEEPMTYLHGSSQIIPGLESALLGKSAGDKLVATVKPEDAYGERVEDRLQKVPLSMFEGVGADKIEVGMQFQADASHGVSVVTVKEINGDEVVIDGNHPLAGETLTFDVEVMAVREATGDELNQEHVHGEGCNHE